MQVANAHPLSEFDEGDKIGQPGPDGELGDFRFRALLAAEDWMSLPPAVRRRFSKRLAPGATVLYAGRVTEMQQTLAGRLLAQAARLIGAPLPLSGESGGAAAVAVTEDSAGDGQIWTRLYSRRDRFPQVIHSAKRFSGATGLEEQVGGGVGMALTIHVEEGALFFRSAGYFLRAFGTRIPIPAFLTPGKLEVVHRDAGSARFTFTLSLSHPLFGLMLRQVALFREAAP